ncbi:DUF2637 domain-containing protein [Micromonospora sp. 4G57]|uniref:DUF2637 domain-containing protein n=1 Tax=Micromonospora sicca TaxID=2202420 RepID=A0ABU5JMT6_9ACTN|nr:MULTISPECIES: DUF2637 domain-containing protein [unclassified Micromonospora]MDZ5447248.1 DUF2637 domain-containing protein [Micromonospora sp. 4G57]MDZ5493944.1 DUF2637 domain-containing protein [Micromonospora sp. 4G53]
MSTATAPAAHAEAGEREPRQLRRLRWGVRAVLALGVAASIAANVLHARPNPVSQVISAWPPLALMLTVELISRVPTHRRLLAAVRMVAAAPIAAIAAWVSYWHMAGVAARYGETEAAAAYLLPLSVDGLVVVASVSLVEITGRLRAATAPHVTGEPAPGAPGRRRLDGPSRSVPTAAGVAPPVAHPAALPPHIAAAPSTSPHAQEPPAGNSERVDGDQQPEQALVDQSTTAGAGDQIGADLRASAELNTQDPRPAAAPATGPTPPPQPHGDSAATRHSRHGDEEAVPPTTAAAVAYWHRRDPNLHPAQIAARIGRSERTVRRHWPPPTGDAPRANGNRVDAVHR